MAQLNGLPVFKITFNEDLNDKSGMGFISTVDYPAIESNWVAMGDNKTPMKFNTSQDKQMLYGPILIPNLPIYRYNDETKTEYYVVFTEEVIEKLVRKFQLQQKTINLNYQHLKDSQLKDAVIQEIWLTGQVDKSQTLGFDLPKGSAFIAAHIGDKEFWEKEVKTGNVKGFSIEGFLDMEMRSIKKTNMTQKFITAKTDTGIEIKSDSENFATGIEVYTEVEGVKSPVADGTYSLENGTMITVAEGKITEMLEEEMSTEQVEVIQKAANTKSLTDDIATLKAELKELQTKLANMPGAPSATSKTDGDEPRTATKLSVKKQLETKLSIFRKKHKEVTS